MAKRRMYKQYEEEEQRRRLRSVNSEEELQKFNGLTSVNNAMEMESTRNVNAEEEESEQPKLRGAMLPKAQGERDPRMDKDAIEEEHLGLSEDNFLISRKVSPQDLEAHADLEEREFLGSNMRKAKDFASIFGRGQSSEEHPKIDLTYNIENNTPFRKELMAKQLLRNFHSRNLSEVKNARRILKELRIDEELLEAIKEDQKAHENEDFIQQLGDLIPDTDM